MSKMKNVYTILLSIALLVMIVFFQSFVRIDYLFILLVVACITSYYFNKQMLSVFPELLFKSTLIVLVYLSVFTPVIKNIYHFYIH